MIRKNPDRHLSLSKNVERVASPPSIHDSAAHAKLHCALAGAACRLAKLKADPIVIAASPNRYNDIYWSDWRAVRFASFFAERHDYYGGAREYERELGNGPSGARAARHTLDYLEAVAWRDIFADAIAVSWSDQVLALVLQDALPWLVFSGSNHSDPNHVFALWGDEPICYFGECRQRFDWAMQQTPPLRFQTVE